MCHAKFSALELIVIVHFLSCLFLSGTHYDLFKTPLIVAN